MPVGIPRREIHLGAVVGGTLTNTRYLPPAVIVVYELLSRGGAEINR